MPYKFPMLNIYAINYESLFEELICNSTNKLFTDERLNKDYLNMFLTQMEQVDLEQKESMNDPKLKNKLLKYYFETQVF